MSHILEVRDLVKHYGSVQAVRGVSFNVARGSCFGLLGPNGAGKTTTIEVIEDVLTASSGEVLYKGARRSAHFSEEVGIQFQDTALPQFLTVGETLSTFRDLYQKQMDFDHLVKICQLEEIIDRDNRKISGGQRQRLFLAMALANDPELVFLDEPTTGLDPQARRHLWEIVEDIKKEGKTLILTTHYMEEAEILCDDIAIMDQGKIIARGTPSELLKDHCVGIKVQIPIELASRIDRDKLFGEWKEFQDSVEILTQDLDQSLKSLMEQKADLSNLTIRQQNLEDLFLKLTGKELRG